MITRENYEEYIMMHVDGELQPAQEKALQDFLDLNPGLKNELLAYGLTKLSPDTSITFAGKNSLLKPLPVNCIFSFLQWAKYSVAAGIAAIFVISMLKFLTPGRNSGLVKTGHPAIQQKEKIQPGTISTRSPAIGIAKNDTITPAIAARKTERTLAAKSSIKNNGARITPGQNIVPVPAIAVNKIAPAEIKALPYHDPETVSVAAAVVPGYGSAVSNSEERKTFWDKLPIDELKKKELKNIGQEIKNDLDENTLTIKIEKRKLVLSF